MLRAAAHLSDCGQGRRTLVRPRVSIKHPCSPPAGRLLLAVCGAMHARVWLFLCLSCGEPPSTCVREAGPTCMICCILPPVSLPNITMRHDIQLDPHNLLCLQAFSLLLGRLASPRFIFLRGHSLSCGEEISLARQSAACAVADRCLFVSPWPVLSSGVPRASLGHTEDRVQAALFTCFPWSTAISHLDWVCTSTASKVPEAGVQPAAPHPCPVLGGACSGPAVGHKLDLTPLCVVCC